MPSHACMYIYPSPFRMKLRQKDSRVREWKFSRRLEYIKGREIFIRPGHCAARWTNGRSPIKTLKKPFKSLLRSGEIGADALNAAVAEERRNGATASFGSSLLFSRESARGCRSAALGQVLSANRFEERSVVVGPLRIMTGYIENLQECLPGKERRCRKEIEGRERESAREDEGRGELTPFRRVPCVLYKPRFRRRLIWIVIEFSSESPRGIFYCCRKTFSLARNF